MSKLYTEEHLKEAYKIGLGKGFANITIEDLKPIELPSDEEIARAGLDFSVGNNVEYWNGFKHCGDWMKKQILNQNK